MICYAQFMNANWSKNIRYIFMEQIYINRAGVHNFNFLNFPKEKYSNSLNHVNME